MSATDPRPDAQPYAAPNELSSSGVEVPRRLTTQSFLIISMYVLIAFAGSFQVFRYDDSSAYYVCSVAFAIMATAWAINDSRLRGWTFHPVLRMLYLLTCPVSPLIYLVWTRGFRGFGLACFHCVAMIAVANIAFYGMFYTIYFTGYWELYDPIYFES